MAQATPDLVVLDLMLPKVDGYEVTRRLRARGDTPIIMLTARKSEAERIAGLEMGADDYVVKPFSAQELVSRVRAVLRRVERVACRGRMRRRSSSTASPSTRLRAPSRCAARSADLSAKEFDLLATLARRPRQVFNREKLLELVWGSAEYIDPSTVTVHVRRVREKIEEDPSRPRFIATVWGVGYRFEP